MESLPQLQDNQKIINTTTIYTISGKPVEVLKTITDLFKTLQGQVKIDHFYTHRWNWRGKLIENLRTILTVTTSRVVAPMQNAIPQ